jgi:hypothetical protein
LEEEDSGSHGPKMGHSTIEEGKMIQ